MLVTFSSLVVALLKVKLSSSLPVSWQDQELEQTCSKETLPVKEGVYWECEKDEPTLGDTCRLECSDDQVLEHEMMLACTPLGWGPKQPSESVALLPTCKPNVCPNLLNKRINQGGWECRKQNTTKRCKNYRTGELCLLKCQQNFKAAFGHVSVCTEEGWLPRAEDLRCYGCKIPTNPAHGRWNCDVEKSGATVCLLECDPQFAIKGSHIIECDLKQEAFDPDPAQSLCAQTANPKFYPQLIRWTDYEGAHKTDADIKADPGTNAGKLMIMKRDDRTGEFIPIEIDEIFSRIIDGQPLFTRDPFNPQFVKRIDPQEFKSGGSQSSVFHPLKYSNSARSCPKPPPPPHGSWRCEDDGLECSLLCNGGFMSKRPVIIKCCGTTNCHGWHSSNVGVGCTNIQKEEKAISESETEEGPEIIDNVTTETTSEKFENNTPKSHVVNKPKRKHIILEKAHTNAKATSLGNMKADISGNINNDVSLSIPVQENKEVSRKLFESAIIDTTTTELIESEPAEITESNPEITSEKWKNSVLRNHEAILSGLSHIILEKAHRNASPKLLENKYSEQKPTTLENGKDGEDRKIYEHVIIDSVTKSLNVDDMDEGMEDNNFKMITEILDSNEIGIANLIGAYDDTEMIGEKDYETETIYEKLTDEDEKERVLLALMGISAGKAEYKPTILKGSYEDDDDVIENESDENNSHWNGYSEDYNTIKYNELYDWDEMESLNGVLGTKTDLKTKMKNNGEKTSKELKDEKSNQQGRKRTSEGIKSKTKSSSHKKIKEPALLQINARFVKLSQNCQSPPWSINKEEEWSCEPATPPHERCTLVCKEKKRNQKEVYSLSSSLTSFTCDEQSSVAWNVSKGVFCRKCDHNSFITPTGSCKCVQGFAGDGFLCGKDKDQDGVPDDALDCEAKTCKADNCPEKPNSGQEDTDKDGVGDDCDDDPDNDGVKKDDNCRTIHNPDQKDADDDKIGDVCDNCLEAKNTDQQDTDEDGTGDACDDDIDNDGVTNTKDNCKTIYNEDQKDTDGDTFGDVCDNCPDISNKDQEDGNQNLIGDVCEKGEDKDKDGFVGEGDNCPQKFNSDQLDIDHDNIGDLCDDDVDGDGVPNIKDNCPLVANPDQEPAMDGKVSKGKACYNDYDGDGVEDHDDVCPENPKIQYTDFRNLETLDLCETNKVKKQNRANSCTKPKPMWEKRDNGKEIYQGRNSRVSIAVSRTLFGDVDFNGTLFVDDEEDNDWVGIVWGMVDINNFYMLISNRQKVGEPSPLYWQIKRISVEKKDDPKKFDKMIFAIRQPKSVPGYSTILWDDPKKQQWKAKKSTKWVLNHLISTKEIHLKMFEKGKEIVNAIIKVPNLTGGRLGVFCMSQERVTWSAMSFACPQKHFMNRLMTETNSTHINNMRDYQAELQVQVNDVLVQSPKTKKKESKAKNKKFQSHKQRWAEIVSRI